MEHTEETHGSAAFGGYLKRLRETRRLSLDAVEELSAAFPEKVTKSHLSRIENGLALPTFPRLMAMSHIYGVGIASLAERYEIELRRSMAPATLNDRSDEEVLQQFDALLRCGEANEALILLWALADRMRIQDRPNDLKIELQLKIIVCLTKLGRYEYAKGQCEEILSKSGLPDPLRLRTLHLFAVACCRLQLLQVALLALDECERSAHLAALPRFRADVLAMRGNLEQNLGRPIDALACYERALDLYEAMGEAYEVLAVRLNIAIAHTECGRLDHARALLGSLLLVLEAGQHQRLKALALSQLSLVEFKTGESGDAERLAIRSNTIARACDYHIIVFRNCFYLWKIAKARDDSAATRLNERTLRSYVARIEESFPELDEFRRIAAGDEP